MNNQNTPQNFLLAYDGSEHSVAAIRLLHDLCSEKPKSAKTKVLLLTVFTPRQIKDHHYLQDSLEWAADQLRLVDCYQVATELALGYPAEKILEYSQQIQPDLILLGAKGLRSTFGILLGGVAQQVVEYSCCPVLVVRTPYVGLKKILLVVDNSPFSMNATDFLTHLPLAERAEILTLHVLPPLPIRPHHKSIAETWPHGPEVSLPPPLPGEVITEEELVWRQEEEIAGNNLLSSIHERLSSYTIDASKVILRGDAATEILNYANSNNINLIISGSRGLSQIKGIFLGSVSRKLVHYANCSVLVVKTGDAVS